jgi:hypothetical protein
VRKLDRDISLHHIIKGIGIRKAWALKRKFHSKVILTNKGKLSISIVMILCLFFPYY